MTTPRVALLGLGTMGSGMAQNLLTAGFPLTVYNRNRARTSALADAGAQVATSPRAAAHEADIVISMVSDDAASRAVWLHEDGTFAGVAPYALVIESSTLTVGWISQWVQEARTRGCEPIDAPVS